MAAFYPSFVSLFHLFVSFGRRDSFFRCPLLPVVRSEVEEIVHGMAEVLFAAKIAFGGQNRRMPEEELNLFEFSAV